MGYGGRQRLRKTLEAHSLDNSDLREARVVGPYGPNYEVVVPNDECQEGVLVRTANPGQGARPGTTVPIRYIDGQGAGQALVTSPLGASGALVPQASRSTFPAPPVSTQKSIALRVTDANDDQIKVSVAAFFGSSFVEILFEDLVLPGGMNPIDPLPRAVRFVRSARTIVGLTGVSNGSILLYTGNTFVEGGSEDDTLHIHVIDIVTGVVHSREFVFSFPVFSSDFRAQGWNIQDGKYYYMFENISEQRTELVTFSPTLTSQTTLSTEIYAPGGELSFGTLFLADDALNSTKAGFQNPSGKWARLPFSGGITDDYIDNPPTHPGARAYGLGLRDNKYWVMGFGGKDLDPATDGMKPFFVPETTVISNDPPIIFDAIDVMGLPGWSGWTEMGPQYSDMFKQAGTAGFDIDDRAMYGFPVARTPGSALGFMRLPLDALTWADATIAIINPNPFPPDMVLPDRR